MGQVLGAHSFDLAVAAALAVESVEDAVNQIAAFQGRKILSGIAEGDGPEDAVGKEKEGTAGIAFQLGDGKGVAPAKAALQGVESGGMVEKAFVGAQLLGLGALVGDGHAAQVVHRSRQQGDVPAEPDKLKGLGGFGDRGFATQGATQEAVQVCQGEDIRVGLWFFPRAQEDLHLVYKGRGGEGGGSFAAGVEQLNFSPCLGQDLVEQQAFGSKAGIGTLEPQGAAVTVVQKDIRGGR